MQIRAFSLEDQPQLRRLLPGALSASGAWLLRHELKDGVLRFLFEFERSNGINMYIMLVSIGLELTRLSHTTLSNFCQRSHSLPQSEMIQVASCDLEITELVDESFLHEPLFGSNSSA